MCVAVRLLGVVQIVHDDPIAAFARRPEPPTEVATMTPWRVAGFRKLAFDILIDEESCTVWPHRAWYHSDCTSGATVEGHNFSESESL